jgi:predicted XRE-type DNA-binding protein
LKARKVKVTESTGNVFLDLGFPPDEAWSLLLRSKLMLRLREIIQRRNLTQAKAAKLFGVSQPRVSDLMRGKIERFSVDTLIEMLFRAGVEVQLTFKPGKAA